MYMLFWLIIALVGAGVQWGVRLRRGRDGDVAGLLLNWLLLSAVGLAGLVGTVAHTAFAAETARGIGFPTGNPFQYEVAIANLAIAVVALVAVRVRGAFRAAAGLVGGLWLGGDAIVHTYELVAHSNYAPNNSGLFLIIEIVIALGLLGLTAYVHTGGRFEVTTASQRGPLTQG
jgi:hypothetical protein